MEKFCENKVFVNPDYVEELFSQLTSVDQEKLLAKLCNCRDLNSNRYIDWREVISNVDTDDIVEFLGEDELLSSIDDYYIKEYVEDNDLV